MSDGDDMALIEACRAGRSEAFGTLVRRYQDRLYPTALRLTGREEDAHDLLQEAFLRSFAKLDHFHGESSFYTWLYRITVNLALSGKRRRRPPPLSLHSSRREQPLDVSDDPVRSNPSSPLEQAERDDQIQAALDALAPAYRAVVVMKDLDGLHYEEIAETLNIPIGTVRSRLHRARSELRDRLRGIIDDTAVPQHRV